MLCELTSESCNRVDEFVGDFEQQLCRLRRQRMLGNEKESTHIFDVVVQTLIRIDTFDQFSNFSFADGTTLRVFSHILLTTWRSVGEGGVVEPSDRWSRDDGRVGQTGGERRSRGGEGFRSRRGENEGRGNVEGGGGADHGRVGNGGGRGGRRRCRRARLLSGHLRLGLSEGERLLLGDRLALHRLRLLLMLHLLLFLNGAIRGGEIGLSLRSVGRSLRFLRELLELLSSRIGRRTGGRRSSVRSSAANRGRCAERSGRRGVETLLLQLLLVELLLLGVLLLRRSRSIISRRRRSRQFRRSPLRCQCLQPHRLHPIRCSSSPSLLTRHNHLHDFAQIRFCQLQLPRRLLTIRIGHIRSLENDFEPGDSLLERCDCLLRLLLLESRISLLHLLLLLLLLRMSGELALSVLRWRSVDSTRLLILVRVLSRSCSKIESEFTPRGGEERRLTKTIPQSDGSLEESHLLGNESSSLG